MSVQKRKGCLLKGKRMKEGEEVKVRGQMRNEKLTDYRLVCACVYGSFTTINSDMMSNLGGGGELGRLG